MYRLVFMVSAVLWLSAMTSLFVRDVLPMWVAQDAPALTREQFEGLRENEYQFSIRDAQRELGKAWSDIQKSGDNTSIHGTVLLNPSGIIPEVAIETITDFDPQGELDSFSLDMYGVPQTKICVRGERRGPYFPCELQIGPLRRQASLDLASSHLVGDSFRPFAVLPTLKVGQSWRMQVLNPMAMILSRRAEFTSIIARVTGREAAGYAGAPVECFVVETTPQQVKAWVDDRGRVLKQEMDMPGLGKVAVQAEPYDKEARSEARQKMRRSESAGQSGGMPNEHRD